jgi:putative membrane protein
MALIVGIYSRLIAGLSDVFSTVIALAKFDFAGTAERARVVEWGLLVPLGAGIVSALVIGARIIPHLIETYPHQSLGLFFGLVAGSIAIPWKRIDRKTSVIFLVAAGFAVAAFLLTGIPPQQAGNPTLIRVFATAAVAICAMILPGVSGAFLLKVLGMYEVTLAAVNARDVLYVATFVLGAAVGIGLFSKLLDWLLSNRYNVTMAALVGLMVGAIRALWPWQDADRSLLLPDTGEPIWSVVLLGVLGFASVAALAVWSARIEKRAEQAT